MQAINNRVNFEQFVEILKQKHLFLFTPLDITRLFGFSLTRVKLLLHRYTKRGRTIRLKNGLYLLSGVVVPEFCIANQLSEPSYVSLETALSHYQIIPETVYAITSVSTRRPQERTVALKRYQYHHIPVAAFTGYVPVTQGDFTYLIADPEKALVDYYYYVAKGLRPALDRVRLQLGALATDRVLAYAKLFRNHQLTTLLTELFKLSL